MLVSVVIPTHNYGQFLSRAIDSALAQTYPFIEVIVVDDGSTDDTRERLEPYRDRIRYIYQDNRGVSTARNVGIRNAKGEWIAPLDADDIWHPNKTRLQLDVVGGDESVGMVGSPKCFQMPEVLPQYPEVREIGVPELVSKLPFGPSSVIIRRQCFDTVGFFDEALRFVEDRDLWLRLATRYRALQVCSPCWCYARHHGQMSRRADQMFASYKGVLETFFRKHPEHRELQAAAMGYLYADAALTYREEGRRLAALWRMTQSAWHAPFGVGSNGARTRFLRLKFALRTVLGPAVSMPKAP